MYSSIFADQAKKPVHKLFHDALDDTYDHWCNIRDYVFQNRPGSDELWHFNPRAGWHVRVRYHKRVIVYCIPCNSFFAILLVLGDKAMREAMNSNLSEKTRQIIQAARTHTEGSSFYIEVKDDSLIKDIKKLLAIKLFLK